MRKNLSVTTEVKFKEQKIKTIKNLIPPITIKLEPLVNDGKLQNSKVDITTNPIILSDPGL